jgi:amino acid transporter
MSGFLLVQCTVEKRLYNRGFHIQWNKKIHKHTDKVNEEKKSSDQIQFTAKAFSQSDSLIKVQAKTIVSGNSTESIFIDKIGKNETKKNSYSSYKHTKINVFKKEEPIENRDPVNKRSLIFTIIFALIVIGFTVLLISQAPGFSAEIITVALIMFGFVAAILFSKVFNRKKKTKPEEDTDEKTKPIEEKPISSDDSLKLADSERKLAHKKNNALILTVISLLVIVFALLALLTAVTSAGTSGLLALGLATLFLTLLGFTLLIISAVLWSNYHDATKTAKTN